MDSTNRLPLLLLTATALLYAPLAQSQVDTYPNKPIRLVVPAPAGGPSDTIARVIGKQLSQDWGQAIVVENRAGANSIIANELVARATPDGYTLLVTVDYSMTVNPHTYKSLPYNPSKDFAHISTIANAVCVVAVNATLPVASFQDFVKYASTQARGVSVGVGTVTTELITERLATLSGLKFVKVPYKGSAEVAPALLGGHIDAAVAGLTPFREHVGKGGRIRVLASTGTTRSSVIPDVPTLEELGLQGFQMGVWMGLSAPAGTPPAIVKKLSDGINQTLARPDVKEQFLKMGLDPMPGGPTAMTELIRQESDRWGRIVREKGIRAE